MAKYGLTAAQMDVFVKRMDAELDRERKDGSMQRFTGKLPKRRVRRRRSKG
jgi:hypothetical protein